MPYIIIRLLEEIQSSMINMHIAIAIVEIAGVKLPKVLANAFIHTQ